MSARLYQINHDLGGRLWCGPAAIAAVTGEPTSKIVELVKLERHDSRPVRGMWSNEVARVLARLGYRTYISAHLDRPTFRQWRKGRCDIRRADLSVPHIVALTTHFVVVAGLRLVDNQTRDPILASDYSKQRARVQYSIAVEAAMIDALARRAA